MAENFVNKKKTTQISYDGNKSIKKNIGANVKTKNIDDVSKKLRITKTQSKRLLYNEGAADNYNPNRIFKKGNEIIKLDTSKKFKKILLEQDFVKRIANNKVVESEKKKVTIRTQGNKVNIAPNINKNEIVRINYNVSMFFVSQSDEHALLKEDILTNIENNALVNPDTELYFDIYDKNDRMIHERYDENGNLINTRPMKIRGGWIDTIKINYNNFLGIFGEGFMPVEAVDVLEYKFNDDGFDFTTRLFKRVKRDSFTGEVKDLKRYAANFVSEYTHPVKRAIKLIFYFIEIESEHSTAKIDYYDNELREKENLRLHQWRNIDYYPQDENTCVVDMITSRFPDLYWKIKNLSDRYGGKISVKQYIDFCVEYDISFFIYDSCGKMKHKYDRGTRGKLVNIVHNNHIYLINGGKPKKIKNVNIKYSPIYLYNNPASYFFVTGIRIKDNFYDSLNKIVDGDYEFIYSEEKWSYVLYNDVGDILDKKDAGKKSIKISLMKVNNKIYLVHNPESIPVDKKLRIVIMYTNHVIGGNIVDFYNHLINNEKVEPALLKFDETSSIKSFLYNNVYYVKNDYLTKCYDTLKKMGETYNSKKTKKILFLDYMFDDINFLSIPRILCKILNVDDARSFIPDFKRFETKPYTYKASKIDFKRLISTLDKNKAYAWSLYCLDKLIKVDYRTCKIRKINNDCRSVIFNPYYLYVIRPEKSNPLLNQQKPYAGNYLSICRDEFKMSFTVVEEIETTTVYNYYREIIDIMKQTMDMRDFKESINVLIGTFEKKIEKKNRRIYVGTYTKEFAKSLSGYKKKVGNMIVMFKNNKSYSGINNMSPIATQIKDDSRLVLYRKMLELKLKDEDIVQINTDSISFYGEIPNSIKKTLNPDIFSGWKSVKFKEIGEVSPPHLNDDISFVDIPCANDKKRILNCNYAGCGKTYHIINNVVPELIKNNINYIVLTPSHKTRIEYLKKGYNCDVIQRAGFEKSLLSADHIIIDEFGFIDRNAHDILYLAYINNKSYECYGDFKQLLPVGVNEPLDGAHYLKYMFSEVHYDFVNHRNNFTKEFYDKIIYCNEDDKFLVEVVNKYSSKNIEDAELIISFRKKTKDAYNSMMMTKLGFKNMYEPGVKISCITNDYFEKNNDIYNGNNYVVDSLRESQDSIVRRAKNKKIAPRYDLTLRCIDDDNKLTVIEDKYMRKLNSMFELNYCNNIHKVQGMSLKSYYWTPEDNAFIDNRVAYVVVSRLKNK